MKKQVTRVTAQARGLPSWLPTMNKVVRALNRLGLTMGPVRVLEVPGRKSGLLRPTPVTPIQVDGRWFVTAALPHSDWAQNVRAAGQGVLVAGRRRDAVRIEETSDLGLKKSVLRAFPTEASGGVPFFVRLGLVTGPHPDEFEAIADQVAVFEIHR
jgi:F420H(2)-dependent quinone reductase